MADKPISVPQTNRVVPIAQLGGRLPVCGKLRLGVKAGRGMKSIDTFRLTSPHKDLIDAAAEHYGAKEGPRPWSDPGASPRDQFEVITTTASLRVFLPPDALSTWYELWSGGGVQRRCDGVECEQVRNGPEGAELVKVGCICQREQVLKCKPTSRLNVVLPDLRLAGTWLLESKGWNAMHELAGMEQIITEMQNRVGVVEAKLSIERVQRMVGGQKRNYVVPKLELAHSAAELMSGAANVRALREAEVKAPALMPSTSPPPVPEPAELPDGGDWFDDDGDVVDAEIVEEPPTAPQPVDEAGEEPLFVEARHMATELVARGLAPDDHTVNQVLTAHLLWASRGKKDQWAELTETQAMAVVNALKDSIAGKITADWSDGVLKGFTKVARR